MEANLRNFEALCQGVHSPGNASLTIWFALAGEHFAACDANFHLGVDNSGHTLLQQLHNCICALGTLQTHKKSKSSPS
jgi:hypothetical protein